MNPRKIRAWAGRVLLAVGIAAVVVLGAGGTAQAPDATQASASAAATSADPTWE